MAVNISISKGIAINHNDRCRKRFEKEAEDRREKMEADNGSPDPEPMEMETPAEDMPSQMSPTIDWSNN